MLADARNKMMSSDRVACKGSVDCAELINVGRSK